MKRYLIKVVFLICMCLICPFSACQNQDSTQSQEPDEGRVLLTNEVDWTVQQIINFKERPVDIAMSSKGTYMYILTEDGIIHVYDSTGNLKGNIEAGKHVDQIIPGPEDHLLVLKSKIDKEIQTIIVDLIRDINVKGSPFKGAANAPIVIAVFTNYQ